MLIRSLHFFVRTAVAGVFVCSGGIKLWGFRTFASSVADFGIVSDPLVTPVALGVCVAELVLGLALLTGVKRSAESLGTLLILFMAVLAYGIWIGLDIDCGCWGAEVPVKLQTQLIIDTVILGMLASVILTRPKSSAVLDSPNLGE